VGSRVTTMGRESGYRPWLVWVQGSGRFLRGGVEEDYPAAGRKVSGLHLPGPPDRRRGQGIRTCAPGGYVRGDGSTASGLCEQLFPATEDLLELPFNLLLLLAMVS